MILKAISVSEYCAKAEPLLGVFASERWLSIYGPALRTIGIFRDEKQMIGGFFFFQDKKFGLSFLRLPPYTPHCGFFIQGESKNPASQNGFVKEALTEVCNWLDQQKAALSILAFPSDIVDMQPFIWRGYKVVPNYTYRLSLRGDAAQLQTRFDPKNRNLIIKALKENVAVEQDRLQPDQLHRFFRNSLSGAGANVYPQLERIFSNFHGQGRSFELSAYRGGDLLGTVVCVYDQKTCYYLLGGQAPENRVNGVNNLLLLRSIEKAVSLGCEVFDFEGSMLQGVEKFFRGFGGELVPYYTLNKANILLEMLLKFRKRAIF